MTTAALFEQGIIRREETREAPAKNGRWRASDAGKCEIQQMLKLVGAEQDPLDYLTKLKFQICSTLEHFVRDTYTVALEGQNVTVYGDDLNIFADNELNISGHADIVLRDDDGSIQKLIEVKALHLFFFKKFAKEPIENAYFYGQVQTYMHMANLDEAEILIVERNTPEVHIYPVEFDTDHWLWLRAMYERLNAYYEVGMLPSPMEIEGEMACKFCPFGSRCKAGEGDMDGVRRLYEEALGAREESLAEEGVDDGA
jgi:hypothetical protein